MTSLTSITSFSPATACTQRDFGEPDAAGTRCRNRYKARTTGKHKRRWYTNRFSLKTDVLQVFAILICFGAYTPVIAAPDEELWTFWDAHNPLSEAVIDHAPWQLLLDKYLRGHPDGTTRVAYQTFSAEDRRSLAAYLDYLQSQLPRKLRRDEQFAYWVNLYNAQTVAVVLAHPNKSSILRMGDGWLPRGPWDDKSLTIEQQNVSLNDIEHRILRPIWRDHRIHFVVNCASLGCPNLQPQVFTGRNIAAMLSDAEQAFLQQPKALAWNDDGELMLSSLFDWYQQDFAANETTLLAFLAARLPRHKDALLSYRGRLQYRYDWRLNGSAE